MKIELAQLRLMEGRTIIGEDWLYYNSIGRDTHITINGERYEVSRLAAYAWLELPLDSPLQANHRLNCKDSRCWRPDHLYIGTQSDNILDSVKAGTHRNTRKTHCPRGHEYTLENTYKFYNRKTKRFARRCNQCHREAERKKN